MAFDLSFDTLALHDGNETDRQTGASSVPIYQASTFHQATWGQPPVYDYTRSGNPTLQVTDLKAAVQLAKRHGVLSVVDNTFMSPFLQHPHRLGADIVIHSGTKFLGGHSDVLAGLVTVCDDKLAEDIYFIQNGFGAVLSPHDSWLLMRGIKTLPIRMRQSQATATDMAHYLKNHPRVKRVYYPGLPEHKGYKIHKEQADGPGAVLSFELEDEKAVQTLVQNLRIPLFAVSLGAVETILSYPAQMSHAAMPEQERLSRGITNGLLRLSVGLESAEDLILLSGTRNHFGCRAGGVDKVKPVACGRRVSRNWLQLQRF